MSVVSDFVERHSQHFFGFMKRLESSEINGNNLRKIGIDFYKIVI